VSQGCGWWHVCPPAQAAASCSFCTVIVWDTWSREGNEWGKQALDFLPSRRPGVWGGVSFQVKKQIGEMQGRTVSRCPCLARERTGVWAGRGWPVCRQESCEGTVPLAGLSPAEVESLDLQRCCFSSACFLQLCLNSPDCPELLYLVILGDHFCPFGS